MPRRLRESAKGAMYHVCSRLTRGERVFEDPDEAAAFVAVLREVNSKGDRVHIDGQGRSTGLERPQLEITELLERAAVGLGVGVGEMLGGGRARRGGQPDDSQSR